jgi:hypothetical protein
MRKINKHALVLVLILTGLILAIMATPAFAAVEHLYIIDTVVGNGSQGYSGDGCLATGAALNDPYGIAVDSSGNIYFSDRSNDVVREVAATNHTQFGISMTAGDIYTVAGNGSTGGSLGDGGPATSAELNYPSGVAVDSSGDIFISDTSNNRVREVANTTGSILGTTTAMTAGDIYTVAGNGSTGGSLGNGGPATSAELSEPSAVAFDSSGNLYIADQLNNAIREVANTTGNEFGTTTGSMTIGAIYTAVGANLPIGIAFDGSGNLYMIEANENEVIEAANTTNDEFGTKTPMIIGDSYVVWSGGIAPPNDPSGITFCGGSMCIANTGQDDILEDAGGTITCVAGNGAAGYYGDGFGGNGFNEGAVTAALNGPCGISGSSSGNLYITDCNNNVIRELSTVNGSFQVPFLTASAAPGTVGGTTEVTASPSSYAGDKLTVDVSTSWIADPQVGVAVPTGSGVINNYTGGNINAVAGDYVEVFEVNNGGIVAFSQIQLTNDDILSTPLVGVTISGTPQVGGTLTASVTPAGATATYQWEESAGGTSYSSITGATSTTYTPVSGDLGDYIEVVATGSGDYTGTVTSAATAQVATTPLSGVTISGAAQVGAQLTASVTPTGATATYQWQESSNGTSYSPITGATSSTYTPVSTDQGDCIEVVATGTGSYTGTVTSTATAQVALTTLLSGVAISGAVQVGAQLTASVTPAGATVAYQWQESSNGASYSSITGATASTYAPVSTDQGDYIEVVVTGTGSYYGSVTSVPTAQVAAAEIPLTGAFITGTAQVGSALTASVAPAGATVAYQWQESSNGASYSSITGATASTYTTVSTDQGDYIEVVVTGTGSYSGQVTSASTDQVAAATITPRSIKQQYLE